MTNPRPDAILTRMRNRIEGGPQGPENPLILTSGSVEPVFGNMELRRLSYENLTAAFRSKMPQSVLHRNLLIQYDELEPVNISLDLVVITESMLNTALAMLHERASARQILFGPTAITETIINSDVIESPLAEEQLPKLITSRNISGQNIITDVPLLLQIKASPKNTFEKDALDKLGLDFQFSDSEYRANIRDKSEHSINQNGEVFLSNRYFLRPVNRQIDGTKIISPVGKIVLLPYSTETPKHIIVTPFIRE